MAGRLARRFGALIGPIRNSLAGRLVVGAATIMIVGLIAGSFLLPQLYRSAIERRFDTELRYDLDALIAGIREEESGGITVESPLPDARYANHLSGWYWQIERGTTLVAYSPSLEAYRIAGGAPPVRGENRFDNLEGPQAQQLRVVRRLVGFGDPPRDIVLLVAGDRREMEEDIAEFTLTIVLSLGGFTLVLLFMVFLQVRYGLKPLRGIPDALADIRTGRSDRLTGQFSTEVEPLAREINALLDHNAQVVERARTHVGNLAHALKTPLAVLANEAKSPTGDLGGTVGAQTEIMRQQVEHHLARARLAARAGILGARTSVMPVLEGLQRTLEKVYRADGVRLIVSGPADLAFRGERQDLEEMLGNLLDNACKYSNGLAEARVEKIGERFRVIVEDDGPGIPPEQRRSALKRGVRLDETAPGSGLGLAIVADIAEIYGGTVELGQSKELGGLGVTVELPAAG